MFILTEDTVVISEPWWDTADQGKKHFFGFFCRTICKREVSLIVPTTHSWVLWVPLLKRGTYIENAVAVVVIQVEFVACRDEVTIEVVRIRQINVHSLLISQTQGYDEGLGF